jgi:hypothetical protein
VHLVNDIFDPMVELLRPISARALVPLALWLGIGAGSKIFLIAQRKARRAYWRIAGFLTRLGQTAEHLDPVQRWYRILSEAFKGRQLDPPLRLAPVCSQRL